MKRIIIIAVLAAILLCGCAEEAAIPKLEIIFFDVGKADSFFMQSGGDTLLMDAGKVDDGEYVAEQLRKMGIQTRSDRTTNDDNKTRIAAFSHRKNCQGLSLF